MATRPDKPQPKVPTRLKGFCLRWHKRDGVWIKKIAQKQYRFGSDPAAAWKKYLEQSERLAAGLPAVEESQARLTVRDLCNLFLDRKAASLTNGEIKPGTLGTYREICGLMVKSCGPAIIEAMRPTDFAVLRSALSTGAVESSRVRITAARMVFKYGVTAQLLERQPAFGSEFNPPSTKAVRKARASKPKPIFSAEQIRQMIDSSNGWMKAAVLLGINCGFYSKDVSDLRPDHIDGEFLDNAREKTGSPRRVWLWPETRAALAEHAYGQNEHGRVLLSVDGGLINQRRERSRTDLVASNWRIIKKKLNLPADGSGGFKCLRHTFQTEASQLGDDVAAKLSMGHLDTSISGTYTHRIDDARLMRVSQHVREWLYGSCVETVADESKQAAHAI